MSERELKEQVIKDFMSRIYKAAETIYLDGHQDIVQLRHIRCIEADMLEELERKC